MMAPNNSIGLLLYLHGYSFYAQRVMVALFEKKLCYEPVTVDILNNDNYSPWYLEINPRGEVPVLKDGIKIIPDSNRIVDYLEDNFSNGSTPRLIPIDQGNEVKQKVLYFRELIDSIPANTVTIGCCYHSELISNPRLPFISPIRALMKSGDGSNGEKLRGYADKYPQYRDILLSKAEKHDENHQIVSDLANFTKLLNKVDSALEEVEQQLSTVREEDWLVTDNFTLADIYLSVLLERLSQVGLEERLWAGSPTPKRPLLNKYYQRVRERPSMIFIVPTMMYHIKTLIGFRILAAIGGVALLATIGTAIYFAKKSSSG